MITLLFLIALFALVAWVCFSKIPWPEWCKYLFGGVFALLAIVELLRLAFLVIGGHIVLP